MVVLKFLPRIQFKLLEGKRHQSHRHTHNEMKATKYAIAVYVVGLLFFYTLADFNIELHTIAYYIWDKGKDTLFLLALYSLLINCKKVIKPVLIFSIIRLSWDIISRTTNIDLNHYQAVNLMLGSLLLISTLICLKELLQWLKQRR